MNKIFYHHLISIEETTIELDNYDLYPEEREEFINLIEETLHNNTLNVILTNLPKEHHETFLKMFHESPHRPETLEFLKVHVVEIEELITTEAKKVKKEILEEIRKTKRK